MPIPNDFPPGELHTTSTYTSRMGTDSQKKVIVGKDNVYIETISRDIFQKLFILLFGKPNFFKNRKVEIIPLEKMTVEAAEKLQVSDPSRLINDINEAKREKHRQMEIQAFETSRKVSMAKSHFNKL